MADDGENDRDENPTGSGGEPPKRRRIAVADEDEDDDVDWGGVRADANIADGGDDDDEERSRRSRLEHRAAERRRRRLLAEAADLRESAAVFPGDEFYDGDAAAGGAMREVDAGGRGDDDGGDNGDMDDFVEDDLGGAADDDVTDDDGDYVDEDAAQVLFGAGRGRGRHGGSRGRRRGGGEGSQDYDPEEEEGEGEDLVDNAMRDYRPIAALDTYGREGIDDKDYDAMDVDERSAAEGVLNRRDAGLAGAERRGGRARGFYGALEAEEALEEDEEERRRRRGMLAKSGRGMDDFDAGYGDEDRDGMDAAEYDEFGERIPPAGEVEEGDNFEDDEGINLEAFDVPLREWIAQDRTRREIQRRFRVFLSTFVSGQYDDDDDVADGFGGGGGDGDGGGDSDGGRRKKNKNNSDSSAPTYEEKIRRMCASNGASLEVSYLHLMRREPVLALWLHEAPRDVLDVLREAATRHVFRTFPGYGAIRDEIHVRMSDVPLADSLRDLRQIHLDGLVKVAGVVTRRTGVFPQLRLAYYDCVRCKNTSGPYRVDEGATHSTGPDGGGGGGGSSSETDLHSPGLCPNCESEGPFKLNPSRSKYRNYQRMNLQERPGSVPPGRVPRTKEAVFLDDLVDAARPGEEVEVTGVFCRAYDSHLTYRSGFPVFSTFVVANHVAKKHDASSASGLTERDRRLILDLAADPDIATRIVKSIAPSIYGHETVKMALAMALFGAVPKNVDDKHRIRGDVNVLLLGDPGTAKSQMLKYAEQTAPRAVYSTGKGASAVGLTASVHKDPMTKEWTLEGGALVLADRGVCLIDEFDKMNEQDRTSIHEAMEQQSISVSKAGIVTSLQARCSVIAAANPIGGRYDSSCTLSENVELTDPILQRFDCLCVLQDVVDPVADERLATFVTKSHVMSVPTSEIARGAAPAAERTRIENDDVGEGAAGGGGTDVIPQALLRKYIQYARANVRPILRGSTFDQEKIASLYVKLRKESASSGGVPIAVRHVESIMRMSEAHAKMHLRDYVRDDDMEASIRMMLESFIAAQKFSVRRSLRRSFAKFLSSGEDRVHLLLHILQDMMRNEAMYQTIRQRQRGGGGDNAALGMLEVPLEEFESRASDRRIYDVGDFCRGESFQEAGYTLDQRRRVIARSY